MNAQQWQVAAAVVLALLAISCAVAGLDLARWLLTVGALSCLVSPKVGEALRAEPRDGGSTRLRP